MPATSPFDVLAEEIGAVAGRIEREAGFRIAAAISDLERRDAERELRFTRLEQAVAARLAEVRDGRDGVDGTAGKDGVDGRDGRNGIDGAPGESGADGLPGRDGADGKDGRDGERGADGVPGRDGADGKDGKDGAPGDRGQEGPPGKLPIVRAWAEGVHYVGDVVAYRGGTYQALRDTGRAPESEDWISLAAKGADGHTPHVSGTFVEGRSYSYFDVVALNGGSFIALKDDPGPCPGDGWQLLASPGKRGKEGPQGQRGEPGKAGPAGPAVVAAEIDAEGMLTLTNGDGSTVACDFYPVLTRVAASRVS
jgi:hypothetical protein